MNEDEELDLAIEHLYRLKRQIRYLRTRYAGSSDTRRKNHLRDKRIEMKELQLKIEEMMFPSMEKSPQKVEKEKKSIFIPTDDIEDSAQAAKDYLVTLMKHNKEKVLNKLKVDIDKNEEKSLNAFSRILDYNKQTMPQIKTREIYPVSKRELDNAVKSPKQLRKFVRELINQAHKIYPDLELVFSKQELDFLNKTSQQQHIGLHAILREGIVRVILQDASLRVSNEMADQPQELMKFFANVKTVEASLRKESRYYSPYNVNQSKMEQVKNTLGDVKEKAAEFISRLKSRW